MGRRPDPRIRAWVADPSRSVPSGSDERPALAVMALAAIREIVPDVRLVVLVADEDAGVPWRSSLRELGVPIADEARHGGLDAVVLVADRFSLSRLEGSPRELWVDDGTLDILLEFFARGAWRLLLTSPELGSIAWSRPPREKQPTTRWLAQILAPRPLQGADDAHVYGIDLDSSSSRADHDGVVGKRTVQIKTTSKGRGKGLAWRDATVPPDHLLVVHLSPGRPFEAFYNGPYAIVWDHMRHKKKADANNVRHVRVNMLLELDATVDERDRLNIIKEPPVL